MSAEIKTLHVPFRKWLNEQVGVAYTYHRTDRATGATVGDADFSLYAGGRVLFIEMKDKATKVSAGQKRRHAELAAVGCVVHIVREIGVAIELATEWRRQIGTNYTTPSRTAGVTGGELVIFGRSVFEDRGGQLHKIREVTEADHFVLRKVG